MNTINQPAVTEDAGRTFSARSRVWRKRGPADSGFAAQRDGKQSKRTKDDNNRKLSAPTMILGAAASTGLARGYALLCECAGSGNVARRQLGEAEAKNEIERFDAAVVVTEQKLREVQANVRLTLGNEAAGIFSAQIALLRDPQLREAVREHCERLQVNVEAAIEEAIRHLLALFERIEDSFFRERAADLRDVGRRLLDHLAQAQPAGPPDDLPDNCVLVASDLLASAVTRLGERGIRGLIVENGGLTGHATILVRALGIPMLVQVPGATKQIRSGDRVIVDALAGRVFINPGKAITRQYDQLESDLHAHHSALKDLIGLPAVTRDGLLVKLSANIGQTADAAAAAGVKADGAGLYRTEFVFLAQDHFPTEAEQYQLYRATAEHLHPGATVIRVLDIGSDKPLAYFPRSREANPALGRRGMRLLLSHPAVLHAQLRAILRLSATHSVAILLPMIGGLDDLRAARAAIETVQAELAAAGQPFNPLIPVGAMIETPSAAIFAAQLADEVDFFSVGTNDLVQYLLAADRTDGDPASNYEPLHPAVLHVLATLVATAAARSKPISVCGEMAGDPAYTALLLGLGFRNFSVSVGQLLEIKHAIRSVHLAEAETLARAILTRDSIPDIKALLQEDYRRRRPVVAPAIQADIPATPLLYETTP